MCNVGNYYKAPAKENCPTNLVIITLQECETAGLQLGYSFRKEFTHTMRPAGCFWDNIVKRSFFNTILDPSATLKIPERAGGICKSKGKALDFLPV